MKHLALAGAALATALIAVPQAGAVTYEEAPAFCDRAVVRDFLAPVERLPSLGSPPASGRLPFGPASLRIQQLPSLVVEEGRVGYKLFVQRKTPALHPRWRVTTELSRVDWKGDEVEAIARTDRYLRTIRAGRGAGGQFDLDGVPGPYLVITTFHDSADRQIGHYGFYFRLVRATEKAHLALSNRSYRPSQTVFFRVENYGSSWVDYGVPYAIERLEGSSWTKAPENPPGPWILPLLYSQPGMSGDCGGFRIPPTMPAGRYRVVKEIQFTALPRPSRDDPTFLTAEFDLVP